MMKGIDVSSHDNYGGSAFGNANTEHCYHGADFVIVKATQGISYVHQKADAIIRRAKCDGKLWGFYHYAGGNDPVAEADFFYSKCRGYFGEGIPCLDWEAGQNKSWRNANWCRKFVDRIHELTGVWCLIYVQASARAQVANCSNDCGLWLAGYPDNRNSWEVPNFTYDTAPWAAYTIWQYSSSNERTDRNTSPLTGNQWAAIAKGEKVAISNDDANTIWAFNNYGEGGHSSAWSNVIDTNLRIQAVQVQLTALSEAVKTLAEKQGADPEAVAKAVSDAVAAKLEQIKITVNAN